MYLNLTVESYANTLPLVIYEWPIPSTVIIYLLFVFTIPLFMKNKQPIFFIKRLIPVYDIIQVLANVYLVTLAFHDFSFVLNLINGLCGNTTLSEPQQKRFIYLAYLWLLLKISDFLDTVFFILLKKNSHVTFLHVYHHTTTMLIAYFVFRFLRIEQSALYAFVNCIVHSVMYLYYFLTAMEIKVSWKRCVTMLQIFQFFLLLSVTTFLTTCQKDRKYFYFSVYCVLQCVMYIYLFGKFYLQSYKKYV